MKKILQIKDLYLSFQVKGEKYRALHGINLDIHENEIVGLVGESGCGKSITAHSIVRLLPDSAIIENGEILFDNLNLVTASKTQIRKIRGMKIGMIFQDPFSSLNPLMKIGYQIKEILLKAAYSSKEAAKLTLKILEEVGISDAALRFEQYPHELSGGMRQRVMIAIALILSPQLIIADEPTTALDVTIQAQLLELLKKIKKEKKSSFLLITHDFRIVASVCDSVAVMYAGKIVEKGSVNEILLTPKHPYTQMLLKALPTLDKNIEENLFCIEGLPPTPLEKFSGCPFAKRCPYAISECTQDLLIPTYKQKEQVASCWLYKS